MSLISTRLFPRPHVTQVARAERQGRDLFKVNDGNLKMKIKDTSEDDRWTSLTSPIFKDYLSEFGIESEGYTQKIIKKYIK